MGKVRNGPKTGGRLPGVQNKITRTIKEAFVEAFNTLGGAENLAQWAKENETEFYKLASKLIPTEVNAAVKVNPVEELPDEYLAQLAGLFKPPAEDSGETTH